MKLIYCFFKFEKFSIVTGNYGNQEPKFALTNTNLYVPVVTLSAEDNEKLLHTSFSALMPRVLEVYKWNTLLFVTLHPIKLPLKIPTFLF